MSTATIGSTWQASKLDADVQTGGPKADDWLLPEPMVKSAASTSMSDQRELGSSDALFATHSLPEPCISKPVSRKELVIRPPATRLKLLQQWECVVLRVDDECVECELHDLTNEKTPIEIAEVYLDEFSFFDRALLQEGAVFYWSIGHEISRSDQVRRYSELRVRRMPSLSFLRKRELSREADRLSEILGVQ